MAGNFVDIWFDSINVEPEQWEVFLTALSMDEMHSMEEEWGEERRDRFVGVKARTRLILSKYLDCHPSQIQFKKNDYGKPMIQGSSLGFNLSHSQEGMVVAVSSLEQVGVDLEKIKSRSSLESIAKRCFSFEEFRYWSDLSAEEKLIHFYQLWVRKEALVKATGRGIAAGLHLCALALPQMDRFIEVPTEFGCADGWRIEALQLGQEYVGAFAGPNVELELRYAKLSLE